MLRLFRNTKAQNTMEYAIMIAVIIGAFSAMQLYVRRSMQAKIKLGVDKSADIVLGGMSTNIAAGSGISATEISNLFTKTDGTRLDQYEPYYQGALDMTTTASEGTETGTVGATGGVRALTGAGTQRQGSQTITGYEEDTQ